MGQIRFCKSSDEVRLAYAQEGHGGDGGQVNDDARGCRHHVCCFHLASERCELARRRSNPWRSQCEHAGRAGFVWLGGTRPSMPTLGLALECQKASLRSMLMRRTHRLLPHAAVIVAVEEEAAEVTRLMEAGLDVLEAMRRVAA